MIVVDTSALMAIVLNEPSADACMSAIAGADALLISAGTVAEALVVADRRNVGEDMRELIDGLGFEVVPVSRGSAERVAAAYDRWGKGVHPAALNLGDCYAYALAREHACPLLFIGGDFAATDIAPALPTNG